ncbi:MAG: DUF1080 domain-containing protein [Planctomycetota bacterium]
MKYTLFAGAIACLLTGLAHAEDGFHAHRAWGVSDGSTPLIPGSTYRVHQDNRPQPPRVEPGEPVSQPPPADAVVLFDGTSLEHFRDTKWEIVDGHVVAGEGSLQSKEPYGDFQLHLEWRTPDPALAAEKPWNMGNSGVKIMGRYEVQVFDSYTCRVYPDGSAGAIYAQIPPLVNASRPPGEWQTYDIFFTAPVFNGDELVEPARVTVLHNGVLIQNNTEILGTTKYKGEQAYKPHPARLPFHLQGHSSPVAYRNIWIRDLGSDSQE